ncbi:MAG: hypothetical protein NTV74_07540 [Euryarchaeota archaeon]|nr:hypothetical protein [Euryarchaeota archaeon]
MTKYNTWKSNTRLHKSIIISILVIIASSLSFYFIPIVKSDLPGPYYVRGYIYYWNTSTSQYDPIPSGKTVTLTNNDKSHTITATTLASGAYQANVGKDSGMDCDNGNQIVVNCSYSSQVGENATNIDTSKTFRWCNLTGATRLQNESLSVNVTPWSWNAGTLLIGTTGTNSSHTNGTHFNLTNLGNVKINVYVKGYNITWGSNKWWLNSSAGLNGYTFRYNLSGGGSLTNIRVFNTSFKSNLQFHSNYFSSYIYWQKFGLNITMPSSSTVGDPPPLQTNITFWSVKA